MVSEPNRQFSGYRHDRWRSLRTRFHVLPCEIVDFKPGCCSRATFPRGSLQWKDDRAAGFAAKLAPCPSGMSRPMASQSRHDRPSSTYRPERMLRRVTGVLRNVSMGGDACHEGSADRHAEPTSSWRGASLGDGPGIGLCFVEAYRRTTV